MGLGPFATLHQEGAISQSFDALQGSGNRPLSFISLSHSDNQSESVTKFYNSFKADLGGNVLTLTLSVLRFHRAESF